MRRSFHLLSSLLAAVAFSASANAAVGAGAPSVMAANLTLGGGVHRHPARGRTGALKIRRAARKARNVQRNRKAHRG